MMSKVYFFRTEQEKWIAKSSYVLLPLLGWYLATFWGALAGFVLAHVVDIFWPRWRRNLTWGKIERVIDNFYQLGTDHSRLVFWDSVSGREFHLYRGPIFSYGVCQALELPKKSWMDRLSKENQDYLNEFGVMF